MTQTDAHDSQQSIPTPGELQMPSRLPYGSLTDPFQSLVVFRVGKVAQSTEAGINVQQSVIICEQKNSIGEWSVEICELLCNSPPSAQLLRNRAFMVADAMVWVFCAVEQR